MLQLAQTLLIPTIEAATQKFAFLGSNGSGKSYAATKLGEEMLKAEIQIVAIDPVGIWHGLRRNADGAPSEFNILVFGGLHGDLPLKLSMAKAIAHLVVSERLSIVLDLKLLRRSDRKTFAATFADEFHHLKAHNKSPVHLFIEEAQNFVPQRLRSGDRDDTLAAFYAISTEGRNDGIGVTLISPSPQDVDKRVLNLSQCLFAFRLTGPQECEAVQKWIGRQRLQNEQNISTLLPTLEVGQPYVWSPGWLKQSGIVQIDPKQSYDSSSSPSFQSPVELPKLLDVDVEAVRAFLEQFVDETELKSIATSHPQITQLKHEVAALKAQLQTQPIQRVEVPILREGELDQLRGLVKQLTQISNQAGTIAQNIAEKLERSTSNCANLKIENIPQPEASSKPTVSAEIVPSAQVKQQVLPLKNNDTPQHKERTQDSVELFVLKPPHQRMINVLGELLSMGVDQLSLQNLAILSGQSPTSSNPPKFARQLIESGLLEQTGAGNKKLLSLTERGKQHVNPEHSIQIRSQADLHQRWLEWLDKNYGNGHAQFLEFLIEASAEGESRSREELANRANYSLTSSGPSAKLRDLEELGLIEKTQSNTYQLSQLLSVQFPASVTP